jgi:two-component system, NarL family, sensor histidine kinase UhpB
MVTDWSFLHTPTAVLLLAALLGGLIAWLAAHLGRSWRESEHYRIMVEQSVDAFWLAEGGRLRTVNDACVALLGARSAAELTGQELRAVLPVPPPAARWPHPPGQPPAVHQTQVRRLDGRPIDVELSLVEIPDHGRGALQGVMRDITERRRAEAELQATQAALLQAQQIARVGYATFDVAAGTWTIAPALAELLGLPSGATLRYTDGWQVVHPDDRAALSAHLEQDVLTGRRPYDHEYRIVRANDGEVRWLHTIGRVERGTDGRVSKLFATVQDITDRKLATLALEQSREELARLSASIIWAREAERRRVARELHDELGQRLSVLKLDLAALLAQPVSPWPDGAARVQQLASGVDEALAATRRLASDLRPAMLDDLGLNAALEWLAEGWSRRTGITITLDGDLVEDSLSEAGAITVYRIVQEALTNVTRHAQAAHAHIDLRRDGHELVVVVEDDGRGLAPGDVDKRDSSGLAGIRERARILGGRAAIDNRPEGGCRLEVRLPLERIDNTHGPLEAAA